MINMLIWNKDLVQPYETLHNIASKICFINFCNRKTINISYPSSFEYSVERFTKEYNGLDLILGHNEIKNLKKHQEDLLGLFSNSFDQNAEHLFRSEFQVCPKCIESGYHSLYHQFVFMDKCFIHDIPLIRKCPNCSSSDFEWLQNDTGRAYVCRNCNYDFIKLPIEKFISKNFDSLDYKSNRTHNSYYNNALIISINTNTKKQEFSSDDYNNFLYDYFINGTVFRSPDFIIQKEKRKGEIIQYINRRDSFLLAERYKKIFCELDDLISRGKFTQSEYDAARSYLHSQCWDTANYSKDFSYISNEALADCIFYNLVGAMETKINMKSYGLTKHESDIMMFFDGILINTFEVYEKLCENLIGLMPLSFDQFFRISDQVLWMILEDTYNQIYDYIDSSDVFKISTHKRYSRLLPPAANYYSYKLIVFESDEQLHIFVFKL